MIGSPAPAPQRCWRAVLHKFPSLRGCSTRRLQDSDRATPDTRAKRSLQSKSAWHVPVTPARPNSMLSQARRSGPLEPVQPAQWRLEGWRDHFSNQSRYRSKHSFCGRATLAGEIPLFFDNYPEIYLQFVRHLHGATSGAHRVYPEFRLPDLGLPEIGTAIAVHVHCNRARLSV